ncbi:hypothetical protein Alg130_11190 [Pyrenophora tritici-repentis]|nr:hypothetical protein Alg130_11190 [Pyrenophora tritici-repentis]KAI0604924.1 hypothetical protein TUN205_10828 [Pyrenophora tritici-repentis]
MAHRNLFADPATLAAEVIETQGRCPVTRPDTPDWTKPYDFDFVMHLDERLRQLMNQMAMREQEYGKDAAESRHAHTPESVLAKYKTEYDKAQRESRFDRIAETPEEEYIRELWEGVPTEYKQNVPLPKLHPEPWEDSGIAQLSYENPARFREIMDKFQRFQNGRRDKTNNHDSYLHEPRQADWAAQSQQSTNRSQGNLISDSTCTPKFPAPITQDAASWVTSRKSA